MNTKNRWTSIAAMFGLLLGAQTTLSGCFKECTDTTPEDELCSCAYNNETDYCRGRLGDRDGQPTDGLTCSGLQTNEQAQNWTLTLVDNVSLCSAVTTRYANTEQEAIGCAQISGITVYGGDQVCDYFITRNCGQNDTCGSYSITGRTRDEALACYRYTFPTCTVRDVTDQARPSGGCYGYENGVSSWPCP